MKSERNDICKYPDCTNPIPDDVRIDTEYCCEKCGYSHRNALRREKNKLRNIIIKELDRNDLILEKLYENFNTEVARETLFNLGYRFRYCTYRKTSRDKDIDYIATVFNYKLIKTKNDIFKIEQNDESI